MTDPQMFTYFIVALLVEMLISIAALTYFARKANEARSVCYMTYSIMGALLSDNQFEDDNVQFMLDNLAAAKPLHDTSTMRFSSK